MKPMLCKPYKRNKMPMPCYIQPKLNGHRAVWLGDNTLQSRSYGKADVRHWNPDILPNIFDALNSLDPSLRLDGELYVHGKSLQQIASIVSVTRVSPHPSHHIIGYHIFDIISSEPFETRQARLTSLNLQPPLFAVDTIYCHSEQFGDKCHRLFLEAKYEGSIYRDLNARYGMEHNCPNQENRWNCILKRKDWLDCECTCIGTETSDAHSAIREPHIASLVLSTPWNTTVKASGGLSHAQRIHYYSHPPLGAQVRLRYETLSDSYIPLKPQIECVYE
jgi:hypothetical protein